MPAPETNTARVLGRLVREGWELARHGGSHDLYRHPTKPGVIVVPRHRTLSAGVARQIAKIAGWISGS
ncbi:MAG TPA: type II toxin-antitoxin system HicA family toxin [Rhizomicrobium sp.]|nr:type II toxin-antitoxin system HicA family toxin [Rhizomicrobium sp.]